MCQVDTLMYSNMIATVALATISIRSHNYNFFAMRTQDLIFQQLLNV